MSSSPSAWSGPCLWLVALMVLSIVGIADSGYLLQRHARGGSGFCPAYGCDIVNQGEYAEVKGIPVAAFGIAGYLALLALSVMAAALGGRSVIRAIFILSGVGVIVSAYLVYLQVAVIKSICFWCVVSAITMMSILVVTLTLLWKIRPLAQPERPA